MILDSTLALHIIYFNYKPAVAYVEYAYYLFSILDISSFHQRAGRVGGGV